MKKGDIFTFTAPNGAEVTAVVIAEINHKFNNATQEENNTYLCYAQNRLFTIKAVYTPTSINEEYGEIIVEYCILPDYDALLDRYNDIEVAQAETASGM
jgi:hypothetical protein